MFSLGRRSLRKRIGDLERDVQYREMYFNDTGDEIDVDAAIQLIFKYLDIKVGLLKNNAKKTP